MPDVCAAKGQMELCIERNWISCHICMEESIISQGLAAMFGKRLPSGRIGYPAVFLKQKGYFKKFVFSPCWLTGLCKK